MSNRNIGSSLLICSVSVGLNKQKGVGIQGLRKTREVSFFFLLVFLYFHPVHMITSAPRIQAEACGFKMFTVPSNAALTVPESERNYDCVVNSLITV